jgi:calcineurin-like phosphoesterase family protein
VTKYFFTADTHFDHANIIRLCNRPYEDVELMNRALINAWNSIVGDDDVVFHLGDFAFADAARVQWLFAQLKGRIIFIDGNHDRRWRKKRLEGGYSSASGHLTEFTDHNIVEVIVGNGKYGSAYIALPIILCHYPLLEWQDFHRGAIHLHGHVHKNRVGPKGSFDVGVDGHPAPYSFDEILEILGSQE